MKVIYAPEADDDIFGIVEFVARDKPEAARNWMRKIRETCDTIATQPNMGDERTGFGVPGCRSFSFGSYVIFFRAIEDGIEVARVIHGSRDMRNISGIQRKVFTTPPQPKRRWIDLDCIV